MQRLASSAGWTSWSTTPTSKRARPFSTRLSLSMTACWRSISRAPQQASKLETRLLLSRSEGGTVARAGGNTCAPLSARLDLKAPAVGYGPHRTIYLAGQTAIDANGKVARLPRVGGSGLLS